jgi:predicted lipoprotein
MKKYTILFIALWSVFLSSCNSNKNENPADKFDRKKMLENYAQNLIKPAFLDLQAQVNHLKSAADNFVANTDGTHLVALQNAWVNAYAAWQYANAYNFGPAGEQGLRKSLTQEIGTFPVSESKINTAIQNGANFNDFNRDARGFLAVEFLIFDLQGNNQRIIDDFAAQNRKNFLTGAVNDIKSRVDAVVTAWTGNYYNDFVNNTGTDVGSSTSQLYNEFLKSFESIKNFKVELPLGLRAGQTQTEPHRLEAYYSGKSREMIEHHLKAIENIYYGKRKTGEDGVGWVEYLQSVEGGGELISRTEAQWTKVKEAFNNVPSSTTLAQQINNNTTMELKGFREELQKNTRFFKSDMSSILGISITYSSGDGD